jgi:Cdc6-like AAA superfamily ATPase
MLNDIANVLQVLNYIENAKQTSNDRIMSELEKQDNEYLGKIILMLDEILEILKKEYKK